MEIINLTGLTILVAEDETRNFEYIKQTYRDTGLTILHAGTEQEAIECCRDHPEIRLILMDGMMPVMTGYDATMEIRKFRPELPVVILTACISPTSIRDAVASSCNDYLAKPIGPEELRAVLKKWLVI
ncbi:MAG: response regulator [Bacteroidota bacterium]